MVTISPLSLFLFVAANVGEEMRRAVEDYRNDVVARKYPEDSTHTFAIKDEEFETFTKKAQQVSPPPPLFPSLTHAPGRVNTEGILLCFTALCRIARIAMSRPRSTSTSHPPEL
jgi:hypothetical protein